MFPRTSAVKWFSYDYSKEDKERSTLPTQDRQGIHYNDVRSEIESFTDFSLPDSVDGADIHVHSALTHNLKAAKKTVYLGVVKART